MQLSIGGWGRNSSLHLSQEHVPDMFDGVHVWAIRRPVQHSDVVVSQKLSGNMRPDIVMHEHPVWMSIEVRHHMSLHDLISVALSIQGTIADHKF